MILLVPMARAEDPLPEWMKNCHVTSKESPWYPKLIEAWKRVHLHSELTWNVETCEVTVAHDFQDTYAFCDVDVPGSPDRGIGEVTTRESCVIDLRIDRISGLAGLVEKARRAAEDADRHAIEAEEASRMSAARADAAAGSAYQASVDAAAARTAAEDARDQVAEAGRLAAQAKADAEESKRLATEAASHASTAQDNAEVATKLARRALSSGGYFLVLGGAHYMMRNEVVIPYGENGVLSSGYDSADLVHARVVRTNGRGGAVVGFDGGYAWPIARLGVQVNGYWMGETTENELSVSEKINGFGASSDLHLDIGRGPLKIGVGPTVVVTMLGDDPSATPTLTSYVLGGMVQVTYNSTIDRAAQIVGVQLRVGKETFNTSLYDYEQTFDAPWAQVVFVLGLGGAPEPPLKESK